VELDLGAIGKGDAVDRVVTVLREAGVTAALVDAGSSTIYALGAPPGESGWKVRVPSPGDRSKNISTVLLRDASLSTSGNYEKFFQLNGATYSHIMDPRTGVPVQDMVQTTVIAKDGTTTDALSTSLFVMGRSASKKLLETMPDVAAIWLRGKASSPRIESSHWPSCVAVGKPSECQNKDAVAFAVSAPSEAQHK
jgi:thiamine biosynthesis lipoprotein